MHVDVLFLPMELPARPRPQKVAVVIDVIRATTSIVTAFQHGVRSILPVASVDEARQAQAATSGALLAGERGGKPLPGFDLGNSPREFATGKAAGRDVVLTTSNGTKTLRLVGEGRTVAIGAFLNRLAVGEWLIGQNEDALIVCSGYEGIFSLEDAVCAGAVVDRMVAERKSLALEDGAQACQVLWTRYAPDVPGLLRTTGWGRHIVDIGLGADLDVCARIDVTDVVPVMTDGTIRLADRPPVLDRAADAM
jgi:2-phosphosulfolactate phosphatase